MRQSRLGDEGVSGKRSPCIRASWTLILLALFIFAPSSRAADASDDFDSYKLRLEGFWFYANPSGTLQGAGDRTSIDIRRDLSFNRYSTFAGKLDWRFTRKNHLTFAAAPFDHSAQTILTRTIVFQGQTFDVGLVARANLRAPAYAPGYQYDIIRRKRGHLGIAAQVNIFDTSATISAAAQLSGSVSHPAVSARGSLVAPIPVAGPEFRYYLTNSPRLFVEGNAYGMYLFGYGNFVTTTGAVGLTMARHLSLNAGYLLGSRLVVNNKSDRLGIRLTTKGPVVGFEFSW